MVPASGNFQRIARRLKHFDKRRGMNMRTSGQHEFLFHLLIFLA